MVKDDEVSEKNATLSHASVLSAVVRNVLPIAPISERLASLAFHKGGPYVAGHEASSVGVRICSWQLAVAHL
jgi:hypothetical protein